MTMEFREPGYFESFTVTFLDPEGACRGLDGDAEPDATGVSHDDPWAPDSPYGGEDDFLFDPES